MTAPVVSIAIPSFGRPRLLDRTLSSLAACHMPSASVTGFVVENGPKCGAESITANHQGDLKLQYVHFPTPNKSAALNYMLERIDDGLVVFFDDDVRVHPRLLEAYTNVAKGVTGGQFYGGPTGVDYTRHPEPWLYDFLPTSAKGFNLGLERITVHTPDFLGFNWAAFANDIKRLGGFDPNRGPGAPTQSVGQERDMQSRMLAAGLTGVYVPEAFVWHFVPRSRCSPQWVVHRGYRRGVSQGLKRGVRGSSLFGYPRWKLRSCAQKAMRCVAAPFVDDLVGRFTAKYVLVECLGELRGCRLRGRIE